MYAVQRVAHSPVLVPVMLYHIQQPASLTMGDIAQGHLFLLAANLIVYLVEHWHEAIDEVVALLEYLFPVVRHLLFPQCQQHGIGFFFHLEQCIALLQRFVVAVEQVDVGVVILGDDHIQQLPALFPTPCYQCHVVGRYYDKRNKPYMLRQLLISLFVTLELFFRPTLHSCVDFLHGLPVILHVLPL